MFLQTIVVLGLMAVSGIGHAICMVDTEENLRKTMQSVTSGATTAANCPDPTLDKYTYFEITADIKLTKPLSIPAFVHLKGNVSGNTAKITAEYESIKAMDGLTCILRIEGDQVILESVQIDANTYVPTISNTNVTDTGICMKANNGKLDGVTITNAATSAPDGFITGVIDGVMMIGDHNIIEKSFITTKHDGIHVEGNSCQISTTQVVATKLGVRAVGTDPNVFDNTLSGELGLAFSVFKYIPIGQAANLFLLNTVKNTDPNSENNPASFQKIYGQPLDSLPSCGECTDPAGKKIKILYGDDGTCKPAADGCFQPMGKMVGSLPGYYTKLADAQKLETIHTPMFFTAGDQPVHIIKQENMYIAQMAPADTTATTVEEKNAAPPPQWDSKSLSNIKPYVTNSQEMGGGCSLNPTAATSHELNTILALLLCAMVAARACHSSKS